MGLELESRRSTFPWRKLDLEGFEKADHDRLILFSKKGTTIPRLDRYRISDRQTRCQKGGSEVSHLPRAGMTPITKVQTGPVACHELSPPLQCREFLSQFLKAKTIKLLGFWEDVRVHIDSVIAHSNTVTSRDR